MKRGRRHCAPIAAAQQAIYGSSPSGPPEGACLRCPIYRLRQCGQRLQIRGALHLQTSQVRKCRRYVPKNHKSESGCMKPTYPTVYS